MSFGVGVGGESTLLFEGIDQLDVGLTVFDRDLVLVAANSRFQAMLGFPDALCRPGATMQDALRYNASQGEYGPGDVDQQVQQRLALARQFLPHRFERQRPDGTIIEVCGQPLPSGGMVTTYTDVTVARRREAALRELSAELEQRVEARTAELHHREQELARKAALLGSVISNVNQGISFINADLELELCNDKFRQLLQLPAELCQPGTSFVDLARFNAARGEYGPGDVEELVRTRIEIASKFVAHRFERTRPADGTTLEIMGVPTPDGGMVTTYLDITERKVAEQVLSTERQRLSNILKGTNAGTWEWNVRTGEVRLNQRWAEITGNQLSELEPICLQTLQNWCHPQDLPLVQEAFRRHFRGETDYYDCEHRMLHKDGQLVWVAAHGQVSGRTPGGKPEWISGTLIVTTERKEAERRIRLLNETLEQRVEERSEQLNAAIQILHQSQEELARSAANATLNTLAASVSHELGTPLGNSLIAATTLTDLCKRFDALVEAGQLKRSDLAGFLRSMREGSDLIERSLYRSVELVKNFKQVAADQASEQRRTFELAAVIKDVLNTLSPSLRRQSHQVVTHIADGIAMDSFPGAIGQVVINLVNNAYLHAFEGRENGRVTIEASARDGLVHLRLSDNGVGMSQTLQAQLFQPFFSTKIGRGGTGLGMTIVDNLVHKILGGTLNIESAVGAGTTFDIRLPLVAPSGPDRDDA